MLVPVSIRRLCYPIGGVSAANLWRLELVFRLFEQVQELSMIVQVVDFYGVQRMAKCQQNGYKIELIQAKSTT
jgi:hypothetical protein